MKKEETPAVTGEEFGFDQIPPDLTEETPEATTGEEPVEQVTETAPGEAGTTVEGEVGEGEPKLILDKFNSVEDLKKSYQELERKSTQLAQSKKELEEQYQSLAPVIDTAMKMVSSQDKLETKAELAPEQFNETFLQTLATDPKKALKMGIDTPELREVFKTIVNEVASPYVEFQNKRIADEIYTKVGDEYTVDNGYPVNFNDHREEIKKLAGKYPFLKELEKVAMPSGQGDLLLEFAYQIYLRENPHLLQGWEGKRASPTPSPTPPVTETGAPSSPKVEEKISEEEKVMREIEKRAQSQHYLF